MTRPLLVTALASAFALAACDSGASGASATADAGDTVAGDALTDTTHAPDASETFIPPLEKISKIEFKLGGVSNSFDLNARADYFASEALLKIGANRATRKLEINLQSVPPRTVGHWADTLFSEVEVLICYNDGTGSAGELDNCPLGFTHEAIGYDLTITANEGPDSFVEGTFSATLQDAAGELLDLSDGVFEVKHR